MLKVKTKNIIKSFKSQYPCYGDKNLLTHNLSILDFPAQGGTMLYYYLFVDICT